MVNSPSFPRRQESWLILCNDLFLRNFLNIKQDSRLRGNDGISCVSGCCWGFVKVSGCLNAGANNRQPENAAPRPYGLLASRALAFRTCIHYFHRHLLCPKNAATALKMLARCPTLLRFLPCIHAFIS